MAVLFSVRSSISEKQKGMYQTLLNTMTLEEIVKEFISYLDYEEESEGGHVFNPITIGSCRALMTEPLGMVLTKMRDSVK